MEPRLQENFVMGPDGENGRQEAIEEQQRQQQDDADDLWLILSTSLMLFLNLLMYVHFVWVAVDVLVMAVSVKSTLHLSNGARILHLLAALLPPASTMLIYHIYNELEQQAFEAFEDMFPPDEDGMGDGKRLPEPFDAGSSYFFWSHNQWRYRNSQFWLFALQLPLLLVVLHDLNLGLGYLGCCYSSTEHRGVKLAAIVLLAVVNKYYRFFPVAFIVTLLSDFYGQILPFTQLYPQHLSPYFLGRLVLGVLVIAWWRFRLRKLPTPFVPDFNTTFRLILGQISQDVDMLLLGQLALLGRWMRLTGQAQRRLRHFDDDGDVQVAVIIPPVAVHNELLD